MTSRREKIQAMLVDEPQDEFLRYSLANELQSEGQLEPSLKLLSDLCDQETPYVAAFFRAGQYLADDDQTNLAREYLRRGIDLAREVGDMHAAGEMSELLADLGEAGE